MGSYIVVNLLIGYGGGLEQGRMGAVEWDTRMVLVARERAPLFGEEVTAGLQQGTASRSHGRLRYHTLILT